MDVTPSRRSEAVVHRLRNPYPVTEADLEAGHDEVVAVALPAVDEGCDAIVVNALADYGVERLRTLVDGPVVGIGFASFTAAAHLVRRFSVVTVWSESSSWVLERTLRRSGLDDRCASLRFVSSDAEAIDPTRSREIHHEARSCDPGLLRRVEAEIERAVAGDGAEAIVLGCACMAPAARLLADRAGVPVIDPQAVGYELAELLADHHGPVRRRALPA
jgi:allantoin racemase